MLGSEGKLQSEMGIKIVALKRRVRERERETVCVCMRVRVRVRVRENGREREERLGTKRKRWNSEIDRIERIMNER